MTSILMPKDGHVVVLPSLTLRPDYLALMPGVSAFEERLLFFLLSLRHPAVHITYLSSEPLDEALVQYYLSFSPDPNEARDRLHMLSPSLVSDEPLTARLLRDEPLLDQLKNLISVGPSECHIVPFNVTPQEEALVERLSVPLYGPPGSAAKLADKTAGRRLAKSLGIPVVAGVEDLRSADMIDRALTYLVAESKVGTEYLLKLNDSHAGLGNIPLRVTADAQPSIRTARASFPDPDQNLDMILQKVRERGAVLEVLLPTEGLFSPSVAVEISCTGEVTVLGTHDQLLAGTNCQSYAGCSYPARSAYRGELENHALSVGEALALRGINGLISVDFLVSTQRGEHAVYFCEINLRLGGTTHPLGIAKHLLSTSPEIPPPCSYVATDRLTSPSLTGRSPRQIIDRLVASGLAYSHTSKQGAVLHMVGSARSAGKIGVTCIGSDMNRADELMSGVRQLYGATCPG